MNHKDLNETFITISNWLKPFVLHDLFKINSALGGLSEHLIQDMLQNLKCIYAVPTAQVLGLITLLLLGL